MCLWVAITPYLTSAMLELDLLKQLKMISAVIVFLVFDFIFLVLLVDSQTEN